MKLSNSQLDKWKSPKTYGAGVTLKLSLNMIGTNETNFMHDVLLTDR